MNAGAGVGVSGGASNEGIDGFGEPNEGVAPMFVVPNMGI